MTQWTITRDTLAEPDLGRPARDIAREPVLLPHDTHLAEALKRIRQARTQLAIATRGDVELGVITLEDVLPALMPTAILEEEPVAAAGH